VTRRIGLIALTAYAATLSAQQDREAYLKAHHDTEDQHWAAVTRMPKAEVRTIRMAAGITDVTDGSRISSLDAASLKQRNQLLLVEGNGLCIRLHVLERNGSSFKEVWLLSGMRDRGWTIDEVSERPGPGICTTAPRPPTAHATPDGRIVVEVPTQSDAFQRSFPVTTYSFRWDGAKYVRQDGL